MWTHFNRFNVITIRTPDAKSFVLMVYLPSNGDWTGLNMMIHYNRMIMIILAIKNGALMGFTFWWFGTWEDFTWFHHEKSLFWHMYFDQEKYGCGTNHHGDVIGFDMETGINILWKR